MINTHRYIILMVLFVFIMGPLPSISSTIEEELELKMRAIAKTLRCTVCQNESIWESQAELARQMREIVRERLIQGESPEEIRAYFLSRYGDYILLAPTKKGFNWVLWIGPFFLLGVGGLFLLLKLKGWVSQTAIEKTDVPPPIDPKLRKRIEEELHYRDD